MFDIWAFLLQTLTASGVAVLLLAVKELFRDKLPPRWHFAIWGVLGLSLVIPAGIGGRYVLFNWPLVVETVKSLLAEDYTYTSVLFPFPVLPLSLPRTVFGWIFVAYALGVVVHLVKYVVSYVRLRSILRWGREADPDLMARIRKIAEELNVPLCRIVTVPGLPSAFVCGVFRPILALPADTEIDDKILLHELLHLKSRDTVWSIVICLLRSIHWCNPLLIYCANQAGNDLESRCDQGVLELLEGEERRDYGRILLSMANDRFARTPGSTCVNNGGKNIRRRIESIARFKRYPAGMQLVSICSVIILAFPMVIGVEATEIYELNGSVPAHMAFASARSARCSTPAGAFDAYGKAILDHNGIYRAMCAPEEMQAALAETVIDRYENGSFPYWEIGIDSWPDTQSGYYIYNLHQIADDAYEALFVIKLNYRPDGRADTEGMMNLAVQNLRVEKENHRWVAIPLEDLRWIETPEEDLYYRCIVLPSMVYSGTASDIQADVRIQTVHIINNMISQDSGNIFWGSTGYYDTIPRPNTEFSTVSWSQSTYCTHLGTEEARDTITQIGLSAAPVNEGEDIPELHEAKGNNSSGSTSDGISWGGRRTGSGWGPSIHINDNGIRCDADMISTELPLYYAADLYINGEKAAELKLTLQEGGNHD